MKLRAEGGFWMLEPKFIPSSEPKRPRLLSVPRTFEIRNKSKNDIVLLLLSGSEIPTDSPDLAVGGLRWRSTAERFRRVPRKTLPRPDRMPGR